MNELEKIKDCALRAAHAGADVLMRYYRDGVEMRTKSDGGKSYDLVSDADEESEREIARLIAETFPDHELLGEEALSNGNPDAEHLWVIDPLDGTNNFAHGVPHFAVSIAHYHQGVATVGVVINPARDDVFVAVAGQGAFHNSDFVSPKPVASLGEALIGCGFYYDRGDMMRKTLSAIEEFFDHDIHGIRRFGTASLDLCAVGLGHFGGFFEYKLSPWDFAAGRLFVEESGGVVTTASGEPLPMNPTSVLAANVGLHSSMLAITRKHHP
ncbi:MAG: inositol monophosphatase family protein [Planctomycetota bacterium]